MNDVYRVPLCIPNSETICFVGPEAEYIRGGERFPCFPLIRILGSQKQIWSTCFHGEHILSDLPKEKVLHSVYTHPPPNPLLETLRDLCTHYWVIGVIAPCTRFRSSFPPPALQYTPGPSTWTASLRIPSVSQKLAHHRDG